MTTFRGSCLCGRVVFEVDGRFDKFLNCHCSPAGGFDEPLGTVPDRHVHWASRADWYVDGGGLRVDD